MRPGIVLMVVGLLLAGCMPASEPASDSAAPVEQIAVPPTPWSGSSVQGPGYSIQNLYDWEERSNPAMPQGCALVAPQEGSEDLFRENINIVLESLPPGTTEEFYFRQAKAQLVNAFGPEAKIDLYTPITIGNLKGWRSTFQWSTEGINLKQDSYVFFKNNTAYLVTCSSTAEDYDTHQPTFKTLIGTFQLTE